MIIRRVADAIREQNWFTVIIEVLIVVIGIFLGLQVSEWNEERQAREEEKRLVSQLQIELDAATEAKETWVQSTETWWRTLVSAVEIVQSAGPEMTLNTKQCQSIWAYYLIVRTRSRFAPAHAGATD